MKHRKYKNTGILFELLVRQITDDTLNNVKNSSALKIVKEFFGNKKSLSSELNLYRTLLSEKFNREDKADKFLQAVLNEYTKLNFQTVKREKYNLIKEIKNNYDLRNFFNYRIPNYKEYASVYMLFESQSGKVKINPANLIQSHYSIVEHIIKKPLSKNEKNRVIENYSQQDKDLRLLSYKILVDKFNNKYGKSLNEDQRSLLRLYINNVTNSPKLLDEVKTRVPKLKRSLSTLNKKIDDKVINIKLNEVVNQLSLFKDFKRITEHNILTLLRYYKLIEECKNAISK
jgi:hypothetical protein